MSLEIIETIPSGIIVTNHSRFGEKRMKDEKQGISNQSLYNI
jgi:hypothetical protein